MQIACPKCGEPWDHDSLHEEAGARYGIPFYLDDDDRRAFRRNPRYDSDTYGIFFSQVSIEFRTDGCAALRSFGAKCTPVGDPDEPDDRKQLRAVAASAMYELLGDDLDGAASMLEDFGV